MSSSLPNNSGSSTASVNGGEPQSSPAAAAAKVHSYVIQSENSSPSSISISISSNSPHSAAGLEDKVKHLTLINAISSDDIDAVLNAIFKINASPSPLGLPPPSYGSPLHLVVSLCNRSVVERVLSVFCSNESAAAVTGKSLDWINIQNSPDRETPLHIAAKLQRLDILDLLFQIPNINDTIRDLNGNMAIDLASVSVTNGGANNIYSEKIIDLFEGYKNEFITLMTAALRNATIIGDHVALDELFEKSGRAQSYMKLGYIDINGVLEPETERSFLHLATKLDNLELIVWALKYGADPNVTDKKGKKPLDMVKSERVKEVLKHAKSHAPIISASLAQATSLANSNYNTQNSSLLGVGNQSKEPPVIEGVLLKWTNYRDGYQNRFFVLEGGIFSYYQEMKDYPSMCRGSIACAAADAVFPDASDLSRFDVSGSGNVKYSLKARSPADAKKWVWALKESRVWMSDASKLAISSHSRRTSTVYHGRSSSFNGASSPNTLDHVDFKILLSPVLTNSVDELGSGNEMHADVDPQSPNENRNPDLFAYIDKLTSNESHSAEMRRFLVLLKTEMQVQKESVQSAVELVSQMAHFSKEHGLVNTLNTLPGLLSDSGQHIEVLILGIVRYCNKRELLWDHKLKVANEAHKRLMEVVKKLASDQGEEIADVYTQQIKETGGNLPALLSVKKEVPLNYSSSGEEDNDEFYDAIDSGSASPGTVAAVAQNVPSSERPSSTSEELFRESLVPSLGLDKVEGTGSVGFCSVNELEESAKGYESLTRPRLQLPLDPSKPKPSLAVWSFLKNAIGKDLSKVTLPVLFNEPVSMLQRMCEDIEYIELLSLASRVGSFGKSPTQHLSDQPALLAANRLKLDYQKLEALQGVDASTIRLMLVGAFAMSNYSSTAGRTNKPFNPMLGETYELIQPAKHFRYLSEQVCHHPPVSACYCDSPDYSFWTEVYVKSKFWGKSLELQPLGGCHVSLPFYDNKADTIIKEHYSWKKVTTCVNNLILGTLAIEHYGDMIIQNHRTGEQMVLTFKPKDPGGWFVASKEPPTLGGDLGGLVKDARGNVRYELRGRWDEVLTAVPLVPNSFAASPFDIWKVNVKPELFAENFNLTGFALSLNQSTVILDGCLPLTDSRLRPDQRAMEHGEWEKADLFKDKCETRQRTRRKEIVSMFEQTGVPYGPPASGQDFGEKWWMPRWFTREMDSDTNEGYWKFTGQYWKVRTEVSAGTQAWPTWIENVFGLNLD